VHPFDPVELDVARRRRSGDPRQRTVGAQPRDRGGHVVDHVLGADDADVHVRDEGERAAPAQRAALQHDRAGLGDADGRAGDHRVEGVEVGDRQRLPAVSVTSVTLPSPAGAHSAGSPAGTPTRVASTRRSAAATAAATASGGTCSTVAL
jgi:hypothetical protein